MIVRRRSVLGLGLATLLSLVVGCSDADLVGPIVYEEQPALSREIEGKAHLADKPKIQAKARAALTKLYGPDPREIHVPEGAPLVKDEKGRVGTLLANHVQTAQGREKLNHPGGYALYRRNCLHCHGVTGAGDGPTAPFVFPAPRDFRQGLFKFTSTPNGARPDRDDLRRTIRDGLHGTSMPAFEALLSPAEIEQVIDYVTFLSLRGETELAFIEEGFVGDDTDEDALGDDIVEELVQGVFSKWEDAKESVVDPPSERTPSSLESIVRGRDLFLGRTKEKLECAGCHGSKGKGDGQSFVDVKTFNRVVFGGDPSKMPERVAELDAPTRDLWKQKLDGWGNPLRPADLSRAVYKGGRRPIDLYWRIAKGITGAQMPAHYPGVNEAQIWDLVNFVLALPYQPELLEVESAGAKGVTADAGTVRR
ncbi:c-type cytochrome [Paludisphaera rhizosphaerae]|uniref:c-type cytochrome n=1 Tax=Paludisphaera rhizosphaerae TaxID=2711216 RepID=UPI0013ECAE92|nr:c-type cytochrome [Paludisphaera rhizosphaerae]